MDQKQGVLTSASKSENDFGVGGDVSDPRNQVDVYWHTQKPTKTPPSIWNCAQTYDLLSACKITKNVCVLMQCLKLLY